MAVLRNAWIVGAITFFFDTCMATAVGVLWVMIPSYLYAHACTGENCWPFVSLMLAYAVGANLGYPAMTYYGLRLFGRHLGSTARSLFAGAASQCQSIANSTFIYYMMAEVNVSAPPSPLSRPHRYAR